MSGAELATGLGVEEIRGRTGFRDEKTKFEYQDEAVDTQVRFDLIGQLASLSRLTRATAGKILMGISPKTFALFGQNPEMFLRRAADLIRREKIALAIESLRYEKKDQTYDISIFESDRHEISIENAVEATNHVYDYVAVDSKNERSFASQLEAAEDVVVYAKLPKSFKIPTPGGSYNPDWGIVIETKSYRQIYFVAETKADVNEEQLRAAELQSIKSAERYFADVASGVTFRKIDGFDELLQVIS